MTAGLVLSTLLALAPPEEGEVFIVTSEPAPAPAVEPAPAPAPAPSMDWAPAADTVVTVAVVPEATIVTVSPPPPAPPKIPSRPMSGASLFFGGMVAFSIGVGIQMQQFGYAANVCNEWHGRGFDSVRTCFQTVDHPGAYMRTGVAFGSALVMTSIGGAALGQRAAWESNYGDGRIRSRTPRRVAGAVMLGLGIAAFAAEGALLYMDWKEPCMSFECNVQRRGLWLGVADVGMVGLTSGFGLLAWSGQYRSRMAKYQRMRFAFAPSATPHSLGAKVGLRF
jgi:hypothetical protein